MTVSGLEQSVEIQTHPSVKSEFGSGILMVCSFGDQNDVAVFRELGLAPFQAIDLNGCMTSISGPLEGLSVLDARAKAIEMLEIEGNIDAIEERQQEVPVSERGKNPVEIILLKEWYVRQTHMQDKMLELIEQIEFHRHVTDNSCWIGWTTLASIGQYHDDDGTTLKFQFGAENEEHIIVPPLEPMYNRGRTHLQKDPECCSEIQEKILDCIPELKNKWDKSVVKRKSSIHGWILPTPICLSAGISTNQRFSKRRSQRLTSSRKRNRSYLGCTTLYSNLRSCLSNQVSSMYGSMVWAWTRGAERCPNRWNGIDADSVSNAVLEDEQALEGART